MPNYTQFGRTITLAGSLAAVPNSIVTSLVTSTSSSNVSGAGLNGSTGGVFLLGQNVSVTTSASVGAYNITNPIVVTGTDVNGNVITENLQLTLTGGGETIVGLKSFTTVTNIAIPAQSNALGTLTFGTKNFYPSGLVVEVRIKTAGNLHVGYMNGATDTIGCLAGDRLNYSPIKIFADSTAQDVTLAFAS